MRLLAPLFLLTILLAPVCALAQNPPLFKDVPSGSYILDADHTSITFKINHLGFSRFTGRIDKMDGSLNFDSVAPEKSSLDITLDSASLNTNVEKLDDILRNSEWFNVNQWPLITFKSSKIDRTSPTTAKITGDLMLMGVTKPVTLEATLIGEGKNPVTGHPTLGFSANTSIMRSDYGLKNNLPAVGDKVDILIEGEFYES